MNPYFSIVIPAFNAKSCIIDTLQSVIQQTFKDYEIIVVDDGSTDNTSDIVNTFLTTDFEGGRHQRRVDKMAEMESR